MFPLGFILVLAGIWYIDSEVHHRPPVKSLIAILQNPQNMRAILQQESGTVPTDTIVGPGGTKYTRSHPANPQQPHSFSNSSAIVAYAEAQLGKPYIWGGTGPRGYDCSGLIYAAYRSVGIKIPRVTGGMLLGGKPVSRKNLEPGDIVFVDPQHVMLYAGGGMCVEAAHTGTVIHMTPIYAFLTARRYL